MLSLPEVSFQMKEGGTEIESTRMVLNDDDNDTVDANGDAVSCLASLAGYVADTEGDVFDRSNDVVVEVAVREKRLLSALGLNAFSPTRHMIRRWTRTRSRHQLHPGLRSIECVVIHRKRNRETSFLCLYSFFQP